MKVAISIEVDMVFYVLRIICGHIRRARAIQYDHYTGGNKYVMFFSTGSRSDRYDRSKTLS